MGEVTYVVHSDDAELQAIEVCLLALGSLTGPARGRALRYLADRQGEGS